MTAIEDQRKALMKEARQIARRADRNVIIASSIEDPHERQRLLAEAIQKREIAFARLRALEKRHRQNGWWLPKEKVEMSEVPDEGLGKVIRGFLVEDRGNSEDFMKEEE